jgi:histone H3/H4
MGQSFYQETQQAIGQLKQTLQQVIQFVQQFQQAIRLDSTGKEIRLLGIQRLLVKKGLITEAELTEVSGEVIKEMQAEAEKAAKEAQEKAAAPVIVAATPEQTAQVANASTNDTAVKEVVPPVA